MGAWWRMFGARRRLKKLLLSAVILLGICALAVKDIQNSLDKTSGDGTKEARALMDGNDDGKMMGGADNEGESEIEINEKPKIEKQKVMSEIRQQEKDGDGDGDGGRRQDENNGDRNDKIDGDELDDDHDDDDDDDDDDDEYSNKEETKIYDDYEKNNEAVEIMEMIKNDNKIQNIINKRQTKLENKKEKDKHEVEKGEHQQEEAVVAKEIKPDQDKVIDEPRIEDTMEHQNNINEEKGVIEKALIYNRQEGEKNGWNGEEGRGGDRNEKEGEKVEGIGDGEEGNEKDEKEKEGENKENEGKDAGNGDGAEGRENGVKEREEKGKEEEKKEDEREVHPWKSPLALSGNLAPNETLNGQPVVKVLLFAYQRSGSSFTGELLSSGSGALYVYEPLFQWRHQFGYAPDPVFHQDIPKLLGDLLDCSPVVIDAWRGRPFRYFRRKPKGVKDFCKDASLRVVKTIRPRISHVLPWLLHRQDIKVVHLVRDPRGVLNSVSHGGSMWTDQNRDAMYQCTSLVEDVGLEQLGPNRYLRVRYEDLVDKSLEETTRIFSFMGVPLSSSVVAFLEQHTGMNVADSSLDQGYMKTYRKADFHHDHWKKEMDLRHIRQIENVCQEAMNLLHYPVLPSP